MTLLGCLITWVVEGFHPYYWPTRCPGCRLWSARWRVASACCARCWERDNPA